MSKTVQLIGRIEMSMWTVKGSLHLKHRKFDITQNRHKVSFNKINKFVLASIKD